MLRAGSYCTLRYVGQVATTCGGLLIRLPLAMKQTAPFAACRYAGQVATTCDAVLWGSQSWLQPAFSRLSSPRDTSVSAARDALAGDRLSLVWTPLRLEHARQCHCLRQFPLCLTVLGISSVGAKNRSLTFAALIRVLPVCSELQSRDRRGAVDPNGFPQID